MKSFSEPEEVIKFISDNDVKILNLCHIPEEGRLKTLSFSAMNKERVREILEYGERVDGSSLFSSIEPGKSDIYVVPDVGKTFANPFAILPTLNVLCNYLDENGHPLEVAPKNVLLRAEEKLRNSSRVTLKALAELEYYVIARQQASTLFRGERDRNYHESAPFSKFEDLRNEVLATLDILGVPTKYGHSEVGKIISEDDQTLMEQHEIEFTPQSLADTAETVAVAKWVVRNICYHHGLSVSFIPKIDLGHAGNGMHIHMCALKDGRNLVSDETGKLSREALCMIGGILKFAPSLAAFGNPTPISYLRFIARKESPMHICWSSKNRLALVRIPLWWDFRKSEKKGTSCRETFEYRAPDPFANTFLLLAGLALAAEYGLSNSSVTLKMAEKLHVENGENIEGLMHLPCSCSESAENLEKDRRLYEADGVFPKKQIDKTVQKLKSFKDKNLKEIRGNPEKLRKLVEKYMDYS